MIRSLLFVAVAFSGCSLVSSQYSQQRAASGASVHPTNVQAAQPEAIDQIPAWYQMAKPVNPRPSPIQQAAPSYYERVEPTYETRREQPSYERPGIQTNQYANYPSYQNRQPYENLNALTSGASLSNLQASRRYPPSTAGASGASGSDMPYDSSLKRYHKLLLKRKQWTTYVPKVATTTTRIPYKIATTTTTTTTTTTPEPTTTKRMPKSLKSIYSTIIPKSKSTEVPSTESTTIETVTETSSTFRPKNRRVTNSGSTYKTFGPYIQGRKGWRMWKKVTPRGKYAGKGAITTTTPAVEEVETTTNTEEITTTTAIDTITEIPFDKIEKIVEELETITTEQPTTTPVSTTEPITTTTSETTTESPEIDEKSTETKGSLRYICRHKAGSNEHDPFSERRLSTIGPFRPITVGTHKWKPLRFKKPEPTVDLNTTTIGTNQTYSGPKGLRLLEYLLKQTDIFAKGLQNALDGPNTELLAAIKDVVAKFKASLDEAGIDQDVRLMGSQLRNTWQQLRTGTPQQRGLDRGVKAVRQSAENSVTQFNYGPHPGHVGPPGQGGPGPAQIPYQYYPHRPMNEQLGRLFEKAVADAADQKQQQQLTHPQLQSQTLSSSRP